MVYTKNTPHSYVPAVRAPHLSMSVQNVAEEAVRVGESLRACTLADADHAVLLRVQHSAL